ncbi:hypothetical protein [Mycobacterium sp. MS1601]|uniref:hypothetical protein n=1 Tax=Mycobacterium sp. MS1601 TaxID=1936029 RepID=UPI0012F88400|nr:hypothetical protein [Mycobacterium sp. MS1601]
MNAPLLPAWLMVPAAVAVLVTLVLALWGAPRIELNRKSGVGAGVATRLAYVLLALSVVLYVCVIAASTVAVPFALPVPLVLALTVLVAALPVVPAWTLLKSAL